MNKRRNVQLALAAGVLAGAAHLQAAITWGPVAETPTTLSGSATWSGAPSPETAVLVTPGGNWEVSLTFGSTLKVDMVNLEGTHLVAPHATDSAPGEIIELGLIFPKANGSGSVDGMIFHNPGASSGHKDSWTMEASALATGAAVKFTANHGIPEPSTYAMVAGLGLLGFATFRRLRR